MLLEDSNRRVIALCGGTPRCDDWETVVADASAAVEKVRATCQFPNSMSTHQRGKGFVSVPDGNVHGTGTKVNVSPS